MIVHDPNNPTAVAFRMELESRVPKGGDDDLVIVLGGDGFLLHTVASYGFTEHTFLGLNAGHLGFLHNDVDDWDHIAEEIVERTWRTYSFPLLQARAFLEDGTEAQARAVNDVYLERATGQTARLKLTIDGHRAVDMLMADGIVFSTALGSTAYTFSAGGPACHPELRVMSVTPICPHRPRLPAFALPSSARVRVDVLNSDRRPVRAVADGRTIAQVRAVELAFADTEVKLGFLKNHDFTTVMIKKILKP